MIDPLEPERLLEALKAILKERALSYSILAAELGVSLPTIKRLLNKTTIPLSRLLEICTIAEVTLGELVERSESMTPTHNFFTEEQDALFAAKPEMMHFFGELFHERRRPSQIARRHKLTKLSVERYLSKLENVGLLERQPGGKVKFRISAPIGFAPRSKVLRQSQAAFMGSIIDEVINAKPKEGNPRGCFAVMKPLALTKRHYLAMIDELTKVVDRYSYLSESPKGSSNPTAERWQLALAAGAAAPETERPRIRNLA